ncbi:MAG: MFS transporter [Spirochaetaceae bacterium]|nr:MAG: MFS transporter [Spirochaetaceae bacterium]
METQKDRESPYRFVILAVVLLIVSAALGLARFGFTLLLPEMSFVFELDKFAEGMLGSVNLAGYLLLSLAGGILAAKFGSKAVVCISLAFVAASLFLTGIAPGFLTVAGGRFLTGLGSGGANVPAMALLAVWFSKKSRGFATGIASSGSSIGLIIAGIIVPVIIRAEGPSGFRTAWIIFAAVVTGVLIVAFIFLKNRPKQDAQIVKAVHIAADPATGIMRGFGALLKTKELWFFSTIYFLFGFAYIIFMNFFGVYLQKEAGFPKDQSGLLLFVIGIVSLSSGLVWGVLSDKIGRRPVLVIIYTLNGIAFCLFGFLKDPVALVAASMLFSVCAWSVPAVMAAIAGDVFGRRTQMGFGIMTFFFGCGQALGPLAAGAVAKVFSAYGPAIIMAGAVSLAGAILLLAVRSNKKPA